MTLVIAKEQLQKREMEKNLQTRVTRANPTTAEGGDPQPCPARPVTARLPLGT